MHGWALVLALVPAFPIPGAQVALDPTRTLTVEQAHQLPYVPAEQFRNPGLARPTDPLIVWLRVPVDPAWNAGRYYLEASTDVGWVTLYYVPPGGRTYESQTFGMRQPYDDRRIARLPPTLRIPRVSAAPLYLRLSVDEESRILSLLRVVDRATISREDAQTEDLISIALVFIGIFISLAVANAFVFAFIRESAYLFYSGWMLTNALFATSYLHNYAWKWLWPDASVPEEPVQAGIVLLAGVFMLAFARRFLDSKRIVPRFDRIALWGCSILLGLAILFSFVVPSFQPFGEVNGRDLFLLSTVAFVLLVVALAVATMLRGSRPARFFVYSNLIVCAGAISIAVSNMGRHEVNAHTDFLTLMIGESIEGWLLFGALAYRLRSVAKEYADEQQRRIEAQTEALAHANALLEERRISGTDALTGIANRRSFDAALEREWDRCGRARAPVSLLLADVDYFKAFNDTYGHVLGDDCLRRIAGAMASCATRPGDLCARYGGEEFAVVLPDTDEAGAYKIAGEICLRIRDLTIPHRGSSLGHVTASIGVATAMPQPSTQPAICDAADRALYKAKGSGRNRAASPNAIDQFAPRAERADAPPLRGVH